MLKYQEYFCILDNSLYTSRIVDNNMYTLHLDKVLET